MKSCDRHENTELTFTSSFAGSIDRQVARVAHSAAASAN